MTKVDYDEKKLPKWAQQRLRVLKQTIVQRNEEIERLRQVNAVVRDREWFTLPGPSQRTGTALRGKRSTHTKLFVLYENGAHPVCTLGPDDVLLVGRAPKE